jgi:hypothetical protein
MDVLLDSVALRTRDHNDLEHVGLVWWHPRRGATNDELTTEQRQQGLPARRSQDGRRQHPHHPLFSVLWWQVAATKEKIGTPMSTFLFPLCTLVYKLSYQLVVNLFWDG